MQCIYFGKALLKVPWVSIVGKTDSFVQSFGLDMGNVVLGPVLMEQCLHDLAGHALGASDESEMLVRHAERQSSKGLTVALPHINLELFSWDTGTQSIGFRHCLGTVGFTPNLGALVIGNGFNIVPHRGNSHELGHPHDKSVLAARENWKLAHDSFSILGVHCAGLSRQQQQNNCHEGDPHDHLEHTCCMIM